MKIMAVVNADDIVCSLVATCIHACQFSFLFSCCTGFPIMNDPLYSHPAWKEGGTGEPVNVNHVISEIVKSNYTTKSHDPAPATETENTKELKDTDDFGVKVDTHEHLLGKESRTIDHKEDTNFSGDVVVKKDEILKVAESTNTSRTSRTSQKIDQAFTVDEQVNKMELLEDSFEPRGEKFLGSVKERVEQTQEKVLDKMTSKEQHLPAAEVSKEQDTLFYDPDCAECRTVHPDPTPSELMMYLHALSCKV